MPTVAETKLYEILTLDNIFWLLTFIAGCVTVYWRLRNYLSDKTREHMQEIADNTAKQIIDQVSKDNMVSEANMHLKIDAEINNVHECTERIEDKVAKMDKDLSVHIAASNEKDKALDRLTRIVDSSLKIVNDITPNTNKPIIEKLDPE